MSAQPRPVGALVADLIAERFPAYQDALHETIRKPAAALMSARASRAVDKVAADLAETVQRLAGYGFHDGQIAYRLGLRRRVVTRIRAKHGIPAALPRGCSHARVAGPSRPYADG